MTNTKPSKTERQSKEPMKGNLGQKEAQLEKEKDSELSHMGKASSENNKSRPEFGMCAAIHLVLV